MYRFAEEHVDDIAEYRLRIQKMDDPALLRQGLAAKYMCSPQANCGKPTRECFVIHLHERRAEWRKRHPKLPLVDSI